MILAAIILIALCLTLALTLSTLLISVSVIRQKTENENRLMEQFQFLQNKVLDLQRQNKTYEMAIAFPEEKHNPILLGKHVELTRIPIPSLLNAVRAVPHVPYAHFHAKTYTSKEMYISIYAGMGKEYMRKVVAEELTKWFMDNQMLFGSIDPRQGEIIYSFKFLEHTP